MSRASAPRGRLDVLWILLYAAVALVAMRLFDLQLLRHVVYAKAAERNRTQLVFTSAPRGRLFDRKNRLIASNRASFSLVYLPGAKLTEEELERLARSLAPALKASVEDMLGTLKRSSRRGTPVRLAQGLSREVMFRLSELKTLYPGVNLVVEAQRDYPYGAFASHAVGFLGDMDARSLNKLKDVEGYRMDSKIGKAGLERLFERDLRGMDGGIQLEVDAKGRLKQVLSRLPSRPGNDLSLTIDADVQRAAEAALRRTNTGKGAVVALEPATGRVLALASVPDFDPNWFVELPTERAPGVLKRVPEFNLALQATYPPGSVFKIVTAAAAFNEERVEPRKKVHCPGYFELGDRVFNCWKKEGHGERDFVDAMRDSCDVYFYQLGIKSGASLVERYADAFGIGRLTGIPLPGESKGRPFGPMTRAHELERANPGARRRSGWRQGDTANFSIGQGGLLMTPLQVAELLAIVANRGGVYRPYVVERVTTPEGEVVSETAPELLRTVEVDGKPVAEPVWDLLQKSLRRVVEGGTGHAAQVPGIEIAGKTGTAQNPHGEDHAWFAAYASRPGKAPGLVVAVLVQHGGHGGETAVPVAREVIQAFFDNETEEPAAPAGNAIRGIPMNAMPAGLPLPAVP